MESQRVKKWMERVDYDIKTAEAMLNTGRYIYAVFMWQQAIEKCFKALITYNDGDVLPIHNLRRLAELSGVIQEFSHEQLIKLDFLSQYYINARYKEDISQLSKGITNDISQNLIDFSKEVIQWPAQKMKL